MATSLGATTLEPGDPIGRLGPLSLRLLVGTRHPTGSIAVTGKHGLNQHRQSLWSRLHSHGRRLFTGSAAHAANNLTAATAATIKTAVLTPEALPELGVDNVKNTLQHQFFRRSSRSGRNSRSKSMSSLMSLSESAFGVTEGLGMGELKPLAAMAATIGQDLVRASLKNQLCWLAHRLFRQKRLLQLRLAHRLFRQKLHKPCHRLRIRLCRQLRCQKFHM